MTDFPLFPETASTIAPEVDALYYFLVAVSAFFSLLIFGLLFFFALKYHRRSAAERPRPIVGSLRLELIWTIIPLLISLVIFGWGARLYFDLHTPPADSLNIYVVAKQWMWKVQHPEGNREINELHIPVNTPVKLMMTSEDVIHSFYIPAFRVKMDVLPGRYTSLWFEASRPGAYHLFCAEYCGTDHSRMTGLIHAMEPFHYQDWLSGASSGILSMAEAGERLFNRTGCQTCHSAQSGARGPDLAGLFGNPVTLGNGQTVIADEDYLRESILNPQAKLVAGFQPLMPTYKGQLSEEEIQQLIAYIRSLRVEESIQNPSQATTPGQPGADAR